MKQIERIERMERYLDESSEAVRALSEALERYEAETGQRLRGVPVCDIAGSLIIPF